MIHRKAGLTNPQASPSGPIKIVAPLSVVTLTRQSLPQPELEREREEDRQTSIRLEGSRAISRAWPWILC
jgi:hypothetical protein